MASTPFRHTPSTAQKAPRYSASGKTIYTPPESDEGSEYVPNDEEVCISAGSLTVCRL